MPKKPHSPDPEIDAVIGANLRRFRLRIGCSQGALAEKIGVTFQQIQKYENCSNRVAASTLWKLSKLLNVQITDFFAGLDIGKGGSVPLLSRDEAEVLRLYAQLPSEDVKRSIRTMMRSFCSHQTDLSAPSPRQSGYGRAGGSS